VDQNGQIDFYYRSTVWQANVQKININDVYKYDS